MSFKLKECSIIMRIESMLDYKTVILSACIIISGQNYYKVVN